MQGACGRAMIRAAIVIAVLVIGAGWSSGTGLAAQDGGAAATPVIPGGPGGIAPAAVDVVVSTPDGAPLPDDAVACVGAACQAIGGLPSGRKVSFANVPQGFVQVRVDVSGRYAPVSTSVRVAPGALVTVELRLSVVSVPGSVPMTGPDEGPTAGSVGQGEAAPVAGVPVGDGNTVATVRALPQTGAGASPWAGEVWLSLMLGVVAIGLGGVVALRLVCGRAGRAGLP